MSDDFTSNENLINQRKSMYNEPLNYPVLKKIIPEELIYLNNLDPRNWAISQKSKSQIRIHFGRFIVFTIGENKIWLAIDYQYYEENNKVFSETPLWEWDNKNVAYFEYKLIRSKNGSLDITNDKTLEFWDKIKPFHFSFINQINHKGYKLAHKTINNHNSELNEYLISDLSEDVPFPDYSSLQIQNILSDNDSSNQPLNLILYGPPGTGKTYKLKNEYFDRFTDKKKEVEKEAEIILYNKLAENYTWWELLGIC